MVSTIIWTLLILSLLGVAFIAAFKFMDEYINFKIQKHHKKQ